MYPHILAKRPSSAVALGVIFLATTAAGSAQDCNQSFNVDPAKSIILMDWNGGDTSVVMSCVDAETMRAQIFINQLAYLSDAQQITAQKVQDDISSAIDQLDQLQKDLANAQSGEQTAALSATLTSLHWIGSKAELLICAGEAADTGGLALLACGKDLLDFFMDTKDTFEAFQSIDEAKDRSTLLKQLVAKMRTEVQQLNLSTIPGTATPQRFNTVFQSVCTQVRKSCLSK